MKAFLLIAVALGGVGQAAAEAPGPAIRDVALDEVITAARRAPTHAAAAAHAHAAAQAVASAGGLPPTTLSLGTSRLQARLIAGIQLPLPVFGRPGAAREVAQAEHMAAEAETDRTDLVLLRDVTLAWYGLAHSQTRADLAANQAAWAHGIAQVARRRFEAGDAPRLDVLRAAAAAARATAEATSESARVDAASASLAGLLGWDPSAPLRARGGLPSRFPDAPPLESLTQHLGAHPALAAARARVSAAQARVVAASRDRWPQLSLGTETEVFDPTLSGPELRVMLNLDVPFFGGRSAALDAAAAERAAVQADSAALVDQARGELAASYRRYQAAQGQALGLARDVLPAAEEVAHLSMVAYEQGQTGIAAVLDAQRALTDVQREWADARLDAATALTDLQRAAGGAL